MTASQFCLSLERFSLLFSTDSILDGHHTVRTVLAEPFAVEVLDELLERHFPGLLMVVGLLAELFRVHPQLASHLDMGVGQVVTLPRVDPCLHLLIGFLFLICHST